jgi:hypothetical protein
VIADTTRQPILRARDLALGLSQSRPHVVSALCVGALAAAPLATPHRTTSLAARFLCARLDSLPSRIAARSKPVPRRADPARPRLVPARSGRVAAHSARSTPSPCCAAQAQRALAARPAALTFSAVAAVRRQTSPLRVAAALLRARHCPARPGRSSTIAVPRYRYLVHRVLVKSHARKFARNHEYRAHRRRCL